MEEQLSYLSELFLDFFNNMLRTKRKSGEAPGRGSSTSEIEQAGEPATEPSPFFLRWGRFVNR